jgi:hypothetical protein
MAENEFFVSRIPSSVSGPESIHFLTNLKRTLSIDEAKRLVKVLSGLLEDKKATTAKEPAQ